MSGFMTYHPVVNFIYFVFAIGFSMVFMNPVCLAVSFVGALTFELLLKGKRSAKKMIFYMLPLMIATALINTFFNHQGMTVISYLPDGNPLTLESVVYGCAAAVMFVSVINWFSCYNEIMTGDKFIYLFGRIAPSLALIFSMTLRFVPNFLSELKKVIAAQKGVGKDPSNGGIVKRVKNGCSVLSVMTTWALENSIETADSMKARGYGIPGRTAFTPFKFIKRDAVALTIILILGIYITVAGISGQAGYEYFPRVERVTFNSQSIIFYLAYFLFLILPVAVELREVRRWAVLKLKT